MNGFNPRLIIGYRWEDNIKMDLKGMGIIVMKEFSPRL